MFDVQVVEKSKKKKMKKKTFASAKNNNKVEYNTCLSNIYTNNKIRELAEWFKAVSLKLI